MAIQSGKVGVSPKDVTLAGRIKGFDPNVYLTKAEAELTYLTIIASNSFLTQAVASATYQTIADMVNYQLKLISGVNIKRINGQDILGEGNISVLTNEIASTIYQTIAGMSEYALKSEIPSLTEYVKKTDAPGYADILTKTLAQSSYMPINKIASASELGGIKVGSGLSIDSNGVLNATGSPGDLSAYVKKVDAPGYNDILTQTVASATYQTIANMANYVTIANAPGYNDILTRTVASTTYQTIANMSNYVTNNTIASSTQLGLVKVGSGLSIDPNGVLSSSGGLAPMTRHGVVNIVSSTSTGAAPNYRNVDLKYSATDDYSTIIIYGSCECRGSGSGNLCVVTTDFVIPNISSRIELIGLPVNTYQVGTKLVINNTGTVTLEIYGSTNFMPMYFIPVRLVLADYQ